MPGLTCWWSGPSAPPWKVTTTMSACSAAFSTFFTAAGMFTMSQLGISGAKPSTAIRTSPTLKSVGPDPAPVGRTLALRSAFSVWRRPIAP